VDGEDRARPAKNRISFIAGAQQDGDKRGLPVVAVEDFRHAQDFGSFQRGAAIKRETLGIVG
jgi:hypothetical protein